MPASDMLEQIKALQPEDRAKVLGLLLELEAGEEVPTVDDAVFDQATAGIIEQHAELLRRLAQ